MGGASASHTILPFPQTKRALRHGRTNTQAAGFLSLLLMEREGEAVPANVQRFDEPDGPILPDRSPQLLLALLLWSQLPATKKERVKQTLRCMVYGDNPDPDALRLHNLLGRR
jgi:hypothetical protein